MRTLQFICFALFLSTLARAETSVIEATRNGTNLNVTFRGEAGSEQMVQFTSALGQPWKPVVAAKMTDSAMTWTNPIQSNSGFFRTTLNPEHTHVENFRMIDHTGKSRELFYHCYDTNLVAIVITFAESNYSSFQTKIAQLKTNSLYKTKALFWTIDTEPANSRTNIARVAAAAGIDWPIFHDPLQLVAREFDANFNGETFVLSSFDASVAYRGVIDDATGRNFVQETLDKLLAEAPLGITRVEPTAAPITRLSRPVADYSTVIAPLLQNKCVTCHSPGNIGPFAMTNHAEIVVQQHHIKHAVLTKMMPPWHADPLYGKFSGNTSLTDQEMTQLMDWINAGAPRGDGPDPLTNIPPEPTKWPVELGEPDQIVRIPTQEIPASGAIEYRYIYANATNTTAKWLKAAVVRPSNRAVVHHYIVWPGHSQFAQLTGIATYVPGHNDRPFPVGTGIQLAANAPLTFNLHYTANGEATTDEPELALWYTDSPPARVLKFAAPLNIALSIPAGKAEHEVTAFPFSFSKAAKIYSFSPHMHVRGLRMRFEIIPPAPGVRRILASIPKYDFMWQTVYTLETPLEVSAGTQIQVIGAFDNSYMNQFNPDPTRTVPWGEQSWDEMFIGYMEYSDL